MGIGSNLKEIMEKKGVNANELARSVGVTPSTIYSVIQRDSKKMSIDLILDIAHALNISADELLGGKFSTLSPLALDVARAFDRADPVRQEVVCDTLHINPPKEKEEEGIA